MARPWYTDGLRFTCTLCGACCSGPHGEVTLLPEDERRLAKGLGIRLREFRERYTMISRETGRRVLTLKPSPVKEGDQDCVFLDRESEPGKAVCVANEHKPAQCRAWPFWPSVVESRESWEANRENCEGIEHGDEVVSGKVVSRAVGEMKKLEKRIGDFHAGWA